MTGTFIASTPKSAMHALAFQGISVSSCYPQIRDMLLHKFGDDYMLLFARPAENPQSGEIDWYTPVQGPVTRLAALPEEERAPIQQNLARMGADILRYAEELIQSGDRQKTTRGNILRLALTYPQETDLYLIGKQPVFTCWGYGPGTPGVEAQNLWRPIGPKTRQTAPGPAPAGGPPARGCLWWLFPLAALALLFALLFGGFGAAPALTGTTLFHFPGAAAPDEGQLANLRAEVESLKSRLRAHLALCAPEPAAKTASPALVMPAHAEDTSFLEGRWLCETGLANIKTREPVKVHIRFDRDGQGEVTIYEKNDKCSGSAKAAISDNVLHIVVNEQTCSGSGRGYGRLVIDCKNENRTICYGTNANGSTWDASFIKIE